MKYNQSSKIPKKKDETVKPKCNTFCLSFFLGLSNSVTIDCSL